MVNDFLFTGGNNQANTGKEVNPNAFEQGVDSSMNMPQLPNAFRPSVKADFNNGGVVNNEPRMTIPGKGSFPFYGNDIYGNLRFDPSMTSGIVLEDRTIQPSQEDINAKLAEYAKQYKASNEAKANPDNTIETFKSKYGVNAKGEVSTGIKVEDYNEYLNDIYEGQDLDDLRARAQSKGEVAARAAAKFTATTAQAFVEPFVNAAYLLAAPSKGLSIIYDNDITRALDEANNYVREANAIYATKEEMNSDALSMANLTSARFIGDNIVANAGFTVGTILNIMATGAIGRGVGAAVKGLKGVGTAAEAAKIGELSKDALVIGRAEGVVGVTEGLINPSSLSSKATQILAKTGNVGKEALKLLPNYLAASAEGGIEARGMVDELKPILDEKVKNGEMTQVDADDQLKSAMNTVYLANVGIVGLSNHIQFAGTIFRSAEHSANTLGVGLVKKVITEGAEEGTEKGIKKTVTELGVRKFADKIGLVRGTRAYKYTDVASTIGHYGLGMASEVAEEGSQFITASAVKDHYARQEGRSYYKSIAEGYRELTGTKEGVENLISAIPMGLFGLPSEIKGDIEKGQQSNVVIAKLQSYLTDKNSTVRKGIEHVGNNIRNNEAYIKNQTNGKTDAELLEVLNDNYFTDLAAYAHAAGSTKVIKQYLQNTNSWTDEEFATNFPTLAGINEDQRKATINNVINRIDELTRLREGVNSKYGEYEDYIQDWIYRAHANHVNTNNAYNRSINELTQNHGINIDQHYKDAVKAYEKEREDHYELSLKQAYRGYKESVGEGQTAKSESEFAIEFSKNNKKRLLSEFDKSIKVATKTMAFDEATKEIVEKEDIINDVDRYILNETNKRIASKLKQVGVTRNSVNIADIDNAQQAYANYLNLQNSYKTTLRILEKVKDPANAEIYKKGYYDTRKQLIESDLRKAYSKDIVDFNKSANKAKPEDVATVEADANKLIDRFDKNINEADLIINNPEASEKDVIAAQVEKDILTANRRGVVNRLEEVKKKQGNNSTNNATGTVSNEVQAESGNLTVQSPLESNEQKDKDNRARVLKSQQDKLNNLLQVLDNLDVTLSQRPNESMNQAIDRFYSGATALQGDLDKFDSADLSDSDLKVIQTIADKIKRLEDGIERLSDDYKNDLNKQEKVEPNKPVITNPDHQVVYNVDAIADKMNLEGTTTEMINQVFDDLNNSFYHDDIDNNSVLYTGNRRTIGEESRNPERVQVTRQEIGFLLFGDGERQLGLIQKYVHEQYGGDNYNAMMHNPETVMTIVTNLYTANGKKMNAALYRYLLYNYSAAYSQYDILKGHETLNNYEAFMTRYNEGNFISNQFNISAKKFFKELRKPDEDIDITHDYSDSLTVNRESLVGNKSLETVLDTNVVFEGAPVVMEVADMTMNINGVEMNSRDIVTNIMNGNMEGITQEVIANIPVNVFTIEGEDAGRLKTLNDLKSIIKDHKVLPTGVTNHDKELANTLENRLRIIYKLSQQGDGSFKTNSKVTRVGVGYAAEAVKGSVNDNIKVPGTKILVAKSDNISMGLYEKGHNTFNGVIHNDRVFEKLQNGISYAAVPCGKRLVEGTTNKFEDVYMIMPLQSTMIKDLKGSKIGHVADQTQVDHNTSEAGRHIRKVSKSDTVGERIKASITNAIDIYTKYVSNKELSDVETKVVEGFKAKEFDITTLTGLINYISEFTHTYTNDPVDIEKGFDSNLNIDHILNNRIKEEAYSIVRVTSHYIELGSVHDGIASVVAIELKEDGVRYSSYSFDTLAGNKVDSKNRKYKNLDHPNYRSILFRDINNILDHAYLRVNSDKLNSGQSHVIPLLNLTDSNDTQIVENGNTDNVSYLSAIDAKNPVDSEGVSFTDYDDYAKTILNSDIKTVNVGGKNYYSAEKSIHVDTQLDSNHDINEFNKFRENVLKPTRNVKSKTDVEVVGKFSKSEVANYRANKGTLFGKAFSNIENAIRDNYDITFQGYGVVSFKDINSGKVVNIDLSSVNNTVTSDQLQRLIFKSIHEASNDAADTIISFASSSFVNRSPLRKESAVEQTQPTIEDKAATDEARVVYNAVNNPTLSSTVNMIVNDYANLINGEFDAEVANMVKASMIDALLKEGISRQDAIKLLDARAALNNDTSIRPTVGMEKLKGSKKKSDNVIDIQKRLGIIDEAGKPVTVNNIKRAEYLRNKTLMALANTDYSANIREVTTSGLTTRYIIHVYNEKEGVELFGDEYVKLLNAFNNNKGFIPNVSPVITQNIVNNLSNVVVNSLAAKVKKTNNRVNKVDDVFANQVEIWKGNIDKYERLINRLLVSNVNSPMIAAFQENIDTLNSLINNIETVKDLTIRSLVSDNLIQFNPSGKTVISAEAKALLSYGESNEEVNQDDSNEDDSDNEGVQEDNVEDEVLLNEDTTYFDTENISINHKDRASVNIKKFLRNIPDVIKTSDGEVVVVTDKFGNPMTLNYSEVYNKVLSLLSGRVRGIDGILNTLKQAGENDPVFTHVYNLLNIERNNPKSNIPHEFAKLVTKIRVDMINVKFNKTHNVRSGISNSVGNSNNSNLSSVIMSKWESSFTSSSMVRVSDSGSITVNRERLTRHILAHDIKITDMVNLLNAINTIDVEHTDFVKLNKLITKFNTTISERKEAVAKSVDVVPGYLGYSNFRTHDAVKDAQDFINFKNTFNSDLKSFIKSYAYPVGFTLTDGTIDTIINNQKNSTIANGVGALFLYNTNNFKAILKKLSEQLDDKDFSVDRLEPVIRNAVKPLVKLEALHNKGLSPVSWRDIANKSVYSFANFKYMDEVLSELQEPNSSLYDDINSTAFGRDCYLLQQFNKYNSNNQDRLDANEDITFSYADGILVTGDKGKAISIKLNKAKPGDIEANKVMMFFNRNKDNAIMYYPTLSDGKNIMMLSMPRLTVTVINESKKKAVLHDSVYNKFFEHIVRPELNRIVAAVKIADSNESVNIDGYVEGSKHFILNSYLDNLLDQFKDSKVPYTDEKAMAKFEAQLKEGFKTFVDRGIENRIKEWTEYGIVNERGEMSIGDNITFKNRIRDNKVYTSAAEYQLNYLAFNMGVNQIFMGDTAAYWKKDVKTTIDNMSKRLAGHRGPGEVGASANRKDKFTYATINDLEVASEAVAMFKAAGIKGADKITSTDGQELTSLYEDMLNRKNYNGVSVALFEALYNTEDGIIFKSFEKMFEGNNADPNFDYDAIIAKELKKKDVELYNEYRKLVNQPVKPMYFGTNMISVGGENIRTATYIKSSSFPLRPSLTSGAAINRLRKALDYGTYNYLKDMRDINNDKTLSDSERQAKIAEAEKKIVHRISFASAVKLGGHINAENVKLDELIGSENNVHKEDLSKLLTSSTTVARKGFRIQQDLPFDIDKEKIGIGSQECKLLFNGLYEVESLKETKAEYDRLYNQMYKDGYNNLLKELTVDGKVNYEKLSDILIKEGLTRKYDDNDIAELRVNAIGDGLESKLMFHRKSEAIEGLLIAVVTNRVLKMKAPGRSYILGTEAGFNKMDGEYHDKDGFKSKAGIIYTSKFEGKLKSHGFISLKTNEYIPIDQLAGFKEGVDYYYQPDQVIVPNYFKVKGKIINLREDYSEGKKEGKYIREVNGSLVIKDEMFDTDALRMFGFRIPTQGHSSMASIEVVGFTDTTVGELVIASKDFVLRMGSDFDIDKLYTYRNHIEMVDGKFTKAHGKDNKYETINRIVDIHHEVFRTPDARVQKQIISPLSYGFFDQEYNPDSSLSDKFKTYSNGKGKYYIGEFIEDLLGETSEVLSPLDPSYQANFYQKGKMGKSGIAMFSSRSVVNAILQESRYNGAPIEFGGNVKDHGFSNSLYNFKLGGVEFEGANFGNNKVIKNDNITIADVISWYQSTSVDNSKLNKLHKLNINDTTIDVINFLNQAGFSEHTLWLINQPIIRDYAKLIAAKEGVIATSNNRGKAHEVIREMYNAKFLQCKVANRASLGKSSNADSEGNAYGFNTVSDFTKHRDSLVHMADLMEMYKSSKDKIGANKVGDLTKEDIEFFGSQLAILDDFIDLHENQARLFKDAVSILNVDSKGIGKDVSEVMVKRQKFTKVRKSFSNNFKNFDNLFGTIITKDAYDKLDKTTGETDGFVKIGEEYIKPTNIVGSSIAYSLSAFESVLKDEFIQFSKNFSDAIKAINANKNSATSSSDDAHLAELLVEDYKRYAHSNALLASKIDIEAEYYRLLIDENEAIKDGNKPIEVVRYKNSLATLVQEIQKGAYANDPLISSIIATSGNSKHVADIKFNNIAGDSENDAKIIQSMYNMVVNNPVLIEFRSDNNKPYTGREFIKDLFIYSELIGGVQRFTELSKFMPHELKKQIGFADALNNITDSKPIDNLGFLIQFIQHHPEYARRVVLSSETLGIDGGIIKATGIDTVDNEDGTKRLVIVPNEENKAFDYLFINPYKYKYNADKGTGQFIVGNEVKPPLVITTKFENKDKPGDVKTTYYKLVYESAETADNINTDSIDNKDYKHLNVNGYVCYVKVDELGEGSKTEYDASVTPVVNKYSATNLRTRKKYSEYHNGSKVIVDTTAGVTKAVFGNFSSHDIISAIKSIANDNQTDVISRISASMFDKIGVGENVAVISRSELLKEDASRDTQFRKDLRNRAIKDNGGVSMFFAYDHANQKGVVVVDEEYYNDNDLTVERVRKDFIHELGHFIVERDFKTINDEGLNKRLNRFRNSGERHIKDVINHLRETWAERGHKDSLDDVLAYFKAFAEGRKPVMPSGLSEDAFRKEYRKYYGLSNFHEFYSELASNDEFVTLCNETPSSLKVKRGESMVLDYADNAANETLKDKLKINREGIANSRIFNNPGSVLADFLNEFLQLFNDVLKHLFNVKDIQGVQVNENSVAAFALYEFAVSANRASNFKQNNEVFKLTPALRYELDANYRKQQDDLRKDLLDESNNVALDETSTEGERVASEKDLADLKADMADDDDFGNDKFSFNVLGYERPKDTTSSYEAGADALTPAKVDKIIRDLMDSNRVEIACKL